MNSTMATIAQRLLEGDRITILCHRKPDGDTLGSGFALYYALRQLGKTCRVRCADDFPPLYGFLFGDYVPQEFEEELVVAVDVASLPLLGALQDEYQGRVDLVVDHHRSNEGFARESWVQEASATAEMIWDLIEALGVEPTPQIAACVYTGLITDTGCFRYSNTTPHALRIAARILEGGLDTQPIIQAMFESKSPRRLALESLVLSRIRYYCQNRCAVIATDRAMQQEYQLDDYDLEGLSGLPRQITGVLVGVTIREGEGECRVSLRTNPPVDASAICAAFGGGGHLRAAGCTIPGTVAEAEQQLLSEVRRHLDCR